MQFKSSFQICLWFISVLKGYYNDFDYILLNFVTFAALSQIWYCQKLRTFWGNTFFLKFGLCKKCDIQKVCLILPLKVLPSFLFPPTFGVSFALLQRWCKKWTKVLKVILDMPLTSYSGYNPNLLLQSDGEHHNVHILGQHSPGGGERVHVAPRAVCCKLHLKEQLTYSIKDNLLKDKDIKTNFFKLVWFS